MSATLIVTREGNFGIELRRSRFDITVDDATIGSFANHETVESNLESGHHTLRINAGRYTSRSRPFDVADGEVITYRCHGACLWPTYVASIVKPDLAISLKRA